MKTRDVVIFSGKKFKVPQGIQRIDHRATHGWQLRYGGTKLFSDGSQDGSGAAASLKLATEELFKRIAKLPAPSRLQTTPNENKTTDLPVGISGPIVRLRPGAKVRECNLSVSLPRFGAIPRRSTIYIGNENTYTAQRFQAALERAIRLRDQAEKTYRREATRAKRAGALLMADKQQSGRGASATR
jgi:hypothetical protein